jgi:hypothetical protein
MKGGSYFEYCQIWLTKPLEHHHKIGGKKNTDPQQCVFKEIVFVAKSDNNP